MLRNKSTFKLIGLFAVAVFVFAFALGLASVTPVTAGEDPCCTIPATEYCSEGIGIWVEWDPHFPLVCEFVFHLQNVPPYDCQVAPICY